MLLLASVKTSFASEQPLVLSDTNIPPEFTASYKIKKSGLNVGEMQLALEKEQADKWIYHSATKPIGIAAVFLSDQPVTDRTELQLAENIIRPVLFEHVQKTEQKDRSQHVQFDWSTNIATAQYKGLTRELELQENTVDNFSLQLLLMANVNALPQEILLPVISKGKAKEYKFYTVGKETINTVYGEVETILVERRKDNEKKSTYRFWVDPTIHGLPLQFEKEEHGKSQYIAKIVATSFLPDVEVAENELQNNNLSQTGTLDNNFILSQ